MNRRPEDTLTSAAKRADQLLPLCFALVVVVVICVVALPMPGWKVGALFGFTGPLFVTLLFVAQGGRLRHPPTPGR